MHKQMKKIQDCSVNQVKMLNDDTYILELNLPVIPENILPGNFAEIKVDKTADVFLRRPFSIYDVNYETKTISFFIKSIGKGTELMGRFKNGENVNIIYPLGNSFSGNKKGKALLIGGGTGVAPLLLLGKKLKNEGSEVVYILGAQSTKDIHLTEELKLYGTVLVTTEDGSLGEKGRVTNHRIWNQISEFNKIYCCGPDPMMKAVAKMAQSETIDCEASLENTMACGFGACLCCVTETTDGNKCVCTDGPVFNVNDLKW